MERERAGSMSAVISVEPKRGKRDRKSIEPPPPVTPSAATPPPVTVLPQMPQPATPKPYVKLPTGPAYNTLGSALTDVWQPYAPRGEMLTPVRISIVGSSLEPPCDQDYEDTLLWNVREDGVTPEAFARLTCEEQSLPPIFGQHIAHAIRTAVSAASVAPALESAVPPQRLLPITLEATCRGQTLRDRCLWDPRGSLTADEFVRTLCVDLELAPDLAAQLSIALHAELQRVALEGSVDLFDASSLVAKAGQAPDVVRDEREAPEWSPVLFASITPGVRVDG